MRFLIETDSFLLFLNNLLYLGVSFSGAPTSLAGAAVFSNFATTSTWTSALFFEMEKFPVETDFRSGQKNDHKSQKLK